MSGSVAEEIRKQAIQELDKIADEGVSLMKGFCPKGKPWSTGALEKSIHKENAGEYARLVGSNVKGDNGFPYSIAVDQGRGSVVPKNVYRWNPYTFQRDDKPSLYMKGLDFWLRPGQAAGPAKAQKFVERTKEALESR